MKNPIHPIYLDYAASAVMWPEVKTALHKTHEFYGNPSSLHLRGRQARSVWDDSLKTIARLIECHTNELVITSGATESNNLAILGLMRQFLPQNPHIITTNIEHSSVDEPIRQLEKQGAKITYLGVNKKGLINLQELKDAFTPNTRLVSIIAANNEIGSVQPINKIGKIIKQHNKTVQTPIYFHTDASQFAAWNKFNVDQLKADLITISAAKIGGPHGAGLLYIKQGTPLEPIIFGGNHQMGLRSGTENLAAAVGLSTALTKVWSELPAVTERVRGLRDNLEKELLRQIPQSFTNSTPQGLPNLLSIVVAPAQASLALYALDAAGICCSAGAACSIKKPGQNNRVLAALGLSAEHQQSTLRFSLGWHTTKLEIAQAKKIIPRVINKIIKQSQQLFELEKTGKKIAAQYAQKTRPPQ